MNRHVEERCFLKTPVGWLRVEADQDGVTSIEYLKDAPLASPVVTNPHLIAAYKQLTEYFAGERSSFNLKLNPNGTDFQRNVWDALQRIPFGSTTSYGELAQKVGCPGGARAVGMANNRNPIPIVIPCHRVVGRNGKLVGYASGTDIKEKLLSLEGIAESKE